MKFSIITAVLNKKDFLVSSINSVFSQNYRNIEYIIIDGGSTDGTIDVIREYQNRGVKWLSEPDRGIYEALNKGVRMATGDIIGFLHADDIYASDRILDIVAEEMTKRNVDCCYGDLQYVDKTDISKVVRHWKSGPYQDGLFLKGWMPPHPTFFVRREIYERFGLFDLNVGSAADYELMLRFLYRHKITTTYIPEVLVKMRRGGVSNSSLKNRIMANRMDRMAWRINGLKPYPWTLYLKPLRKIGQFVKRK